LGSAWRAAADAGRALARAEQLAMLTRVLELWECVPDAEWLTGADHALVLRQAADGAPAAGERPLAMAPARAAPGPSPAPAARAAAAGGNPRAPRAPPRRSPSIRRSPRSTASAMVRSPKITARNVAAPVVRIASARPSLPRLMPNQPDPISARKQSSPTRSS